MSGDLAAWFEEHQERAESNARYQCDQCGRFVKASTVTPWQNRGWGELEREPEGNCSACGRVGVTWGRQ